MSHIASSFYPSKFESSLAISVDGFGDFSSSAWGVCQGDKIDIDKRIFFPHSLGVFYQALTQFIGFPNYGDEYKVMGLAPYGIENHNETKEYINKIKTEIVDVKEDGSIFLNQKYFK